MPAGVSARRMDILEPQPPQRSNPFASRNRCECRPRRLPSLYERALDCGVQLGVDERLHDLERDRPSRRCGGRAGRSRSGWPASVRPSAATTGCPPAVRCPAALSSRAMAVCVFPARAISNICPTTSTSAGRGVRVPEPSAFSNPYRRGPPFTRPAAADTATPRFVCSDFAFESACARAPYNAPKTRAISPPRCSFTDSTR